MRDQNSPPPQNNMLIEEITSTLSSWGIQISHPPLNNTLIAGHQLRANVQVAANMFNIVKLALVYYQAHLTHGSAPDLHGWIEATQGLHVARLSWQQPWTHHFAVGSTYHWIVPDISQTMFVLLEYHFSVAYCKFFTKSLWVCQYVLQNVITLITSVVAILWPLSWAETVCRDSAWPSSLECSCSKNESPKPWTYIYVFIYFYMCLISYKDIIRFISIFVSNAPLCIFVCRYHRIFQRLGSSLQGHQRLAWGRSQGKSPLLIGKPWCLSMFIIYKKGQFT